MRFFPSLIFQSVPGCTLSIRSSMCDCRAGNISRNVCAQSPASCREYRQHPQSLRRCQAVPSQGMPKPTRMWAGTIEVLSTAPRLRSAILSSQSLQAPQKMSVCAKFPLLNVAEGVPYSPTIQGVELTDSAARLERFGT